MNNILRAEYERLDGEYSTKNFELLLPDGDCTLAGIAVTAGQAAIIPPLKRYSAERFCGIRVVFENALLKNVGVCVIADNEERALKFNCAQAVRYCGADDRIAAELGNLLAGYITAFGEKSECSPAVELVRDELKKGVSDCAFSVRDCLKKLPLNYDYLRKLFKKETGVTPAEYLLNERMTLARRLIISGITNRFSNYSVSQLAEACGYSEPLYFSRVFKKYYGVAPSEYKA